MPDVVADSWAREPPITLELTRSLRELNLAFLGLAGYAPARLTALPPTLRAAVADCPYALFDLRFHDDGYWERRLRGAPWAGGVAEAGPAAAVDADVVAFVRTALFYAWHLASSAVWRARLQLGMHERTAAFLAEATLGGLTGLAAGACGALSVRWSDCDAFWSGLAAAAERPDRAGLRRTQLYGLQLAAAARLP
jgi:hypothetical protein